MISVMLYLLEISLKQFELREDIQSLQGKDVLNYRNQIIEVKHLSTVFGEKTVDEAFASYDGQMVPVLIVRNTHRSYGLIVNTIIGQKK